MSDELTFAVSSLYGAVTRKGLVEITAGDFAVKISPEEARALADNLHRAAEAADGDANLVNFLRDKVRATGPQIAPLLADFRRYRDDKRAEHMQDNTTR